MEKVGSVSRVVARVLGEFNDAEILKKEQDCKVTEQTEPRTLNLFYLATRNIKGMDFRR